TASGVGRGPSRDSAPVDPCAGRGRRSSRALRRVRLSSRPRGGDDSADGEDLRGGGRAERDDPRPALSTGASAGRGARDPARERRQAVRLAGRGRSAEDSAGAVGRDTRVPDLALPYAARTNRTAGQRCPTGVLERGALTAMPTQIHGGEK